MSNTDSSLDVSAFHYPKNIGGFAQDTEEATIRVFIHHFQSLNDDVELTLEQLHECWRHAVTHECKTLMIGINSMTQEEVNGAKKIFSWAMDPQDELPWRPRSKQDISLEEYISFEERDDDMDYEEPAINHEYQISSPDEKKKNQHNDALLLLRLLPEMREHAERFYQKGIEKLMRNHYDLRHRSNMMMDYKLKCVNKAQQHLLQLSKASDLGQNDEDLQHSPDVDKSLIRYRDERSPLTQLKGERKKIAKELGHNPLADQDMTMHDDTLISNQNNDVKSTNGKESSKSSRFRSANRPSKSERKAIQAMRKKVARRLPSNAERQLVLYRSAKNNDLIGGLTDNFKNLVCDGENLQYSSSQLKTSKQENHAMPKRISYREAKSRREQKDRIRREREREQLEARIIGGWDKDRQLVPTLGAAELHPMSTNDSRPLDEKRYTSRGGHCLRWRGRKPDLSISVKPRASVESEYGPPVVLSCSSSSGGEMKMNREVENQFKEQKEVHEGDDGMDLDAEMVRRIERLEM